MINLAVLFHISECNYSYPVSETGLALRLQTACNDAERVMVSFQNLYDHVSPFKACEMHLLLSDGLNDLYEAEIDIPERRFKYYFTVQKGNEIVHFGSDGPSKEAPAKEGCFYYPCINPDDLPGLPEWASGETIYQIWTDRFCNGDTSNDPPCTKPWGALPDRSTYYGGDFKGIIEKLPYLNSLGVGVIYLNPVFASPSYHKYDICDFETVDSYMGGEEGLKELIAKAHENGIRIVLDGVLNHCSSKHPIFLDLIEKGENSLYKDWFYPYFFPVSMEKCNYDTFAGLVPDMPRFNTANPEVIEYLVNNTVMWTKKLNLDGWRLDVCDEVSHSLLKKLRSGLTEVRPDILIIGEIWNQAGRWMQGDEIHAVTNYKFRQATLRFLQGKGDALTFWRDLSHCKMQIKTPMQPYLINLNSTHDTERIRRALHHDEQLTLCAAALVMFMDGMPLIYYGDEVFMDGDVDPDSRRAMHWSSTGSDFAAKYRELANYRGRSVILKRGSTVLAYAEGQTLAIIREYAGEKLLCAVNPGPDAKIPLK
ncbi:MAG: glycoside hydrolase family 13 protein, partial [Eubacteriales bacterium]|nr:glycoside hydrolase family 13 protein [Eubacteriales bacterium]